MTQVQYDRVIQQLNSIDGKIANIENLLQILSNICAQLNDKTLIVTTLDKEIETLKIELKALKDEQEA